MLDAIKGLQGSVSRLSNSINSRPKNYNSENQFIRNVSVHQLDLYGHEEETVLVFYLDKILDRNELNMNINEALAPLGSFVKKISFELGKLYIRVKEISHPELDVVEDVVSHIVNVGYEIEELGENVYKLSEI